MEQYEDWDDIVVQPKLKKKKDKKNKSVLKNRQNPPSKYGRELNQKARGGSKHSSKQDARRNKNNSCYNSRYARLKSKNFTNR